MCFWANSRRRIENSVEKAAVFLHPLNIIGLKIVLRDDVSPTFISDQSTQNCNVRKGPCCRKCTGPLMTKKA